MGQFSIGVLSSKWVSFQLALTTGPWKLYAPGVLSLDQCPLVRDHIASPEIIVEPDKRIVRLYFHGFEKNSNHQRTFMATSPDGISFTSHPHQSIAPSYLRVTKWRGHWIGVARRGWLGLSNDGIEFTPIHHSIPLGTPNASYQEHIRHVALVVIADRLWIFYSRIGDAPEHLRLTYLDLLADVSGWIAKPSAPILYPKEEWEGAQNKLAASRPGAAHPAENALRDPAVLFSTNRFWLFYAYGGESGIGVIQIPHPPSLYLNSLRSQQISLASGYRSLKTQKLVEESSNIEVETTHTKQQSDQDQSSDCYYIMGCGRSGTWLLTGLMHCFGSTEIIAKELPVDAFSSIKTTQKNLVLKRRYDSYLYLDKIAARIKLIFIVRHPFDVLTSHNPTTARKYHISPERWIGEMTCLRKLMSEKKWRYVVLRYEDLVKSPTLIMQKLGNTFGLQIATDPATILSQISTSLPSEAHEAMHGVRPISQASINRYLSDPEALRYLNEIIPTLSPHLNWIATQFKYDIKL